ncbi:hypothetical protein OAX78_02855 [Planctomycetota bacterium]|nr:hypothetical protein [Planctomycetota bacterium]
MPADPLASIRDASPEGLVHALHVADERTPAGNRQRAAALSRLAAQPGAEDRERVRRMAEDPSDPLLQLLAADALWAHGDRAFLEDLAQLSTSPTLRRKLEALRASGQ